MDVRTEARAQNVEKGLTTASVLDVLAVIADVVVPALGKGVLIRRPRMVHLAVRLGLDQRAVKRLQKLRRKYGAGPLLLPVPGRRQALILSPKHVHRLLKDDPQGFSSATAEKRAALSHFEPHVSLISTGAEREERRRFNDDILESGSAVHSMAVRFIAVIGAESDRILSRAGNELTWDAFFEGWYRAVRRIVLGDRARDDHDLTDALAELRRAANWAFLHPGRKALRERFLKRVREHLARAEPGSLAALVAARRSPPGTFPEDQVAHWLFAFDSAGIATYRALALIASHAEAQLRARTEIAVKGPRGWSDLPFVRACLLESVRLWPTTPMILRETTRLAIFEGGDLPPHTNVLIYVPFFHRDDETLPYANRFSPDLWLGDAGHGDRPLIPFSEGPGRCPAHCLVPMLGSAMIAALLDARQVELNSAEMLNQERPIPSTLDNFGLRFRLSTVHDNDESQLATTQAPSA